MSRGEISCLASCLAVESRVSFDSRASRSKVEARELHEARSEARDSTARHEIISFKYRLNLACRSRCSDHETRESNETRDFTARHEIISFKYRPILVSRGRQFDAVQPLSLTMLGYFDHMFDFFL